MMARLNFIKQLNKKHQEALVGLWHGALIDRVIASKLGYYMILPKELEGGFETESFIKKLNQNFNTGLGNFDMVLEYGISLAECKKKLQEKYKENETVIIGERRHYFGIWPFRHKGVKIVALTQPKENKHTYGEH
jgi:hypothetical protein